MNMTARCADRSWFDKLTLSDCPQLFDSPTLSDCAQLFDSLTLSPSKGERL